MKRHRQVMADTVPNGVVQFPDAPMYYKYMADMCPCPTQTLSSQSFWQQSTHPLRRLGDWQTCTYANRVRDSGMEAGRAGLRVMASANTLNMKIHLALDSTHLTTLASTVRTWLLPMYNIHARAVPSPLPSHTLHTRAQHIHKHGNSAKVKQCMLHFSQTTVIDQK